MKFFSSLLKNYLINKGCLDKFYTQFSLTLELTNMYPTLLNVIRKARSHFDKGLHDAWSVSWFSWVHGHALRVFNKSVSADKLAIFRYYYRAIRKILRRRNSGVLIQPDVVPNGVGAFYFDHWQTSHYIPYLNRLAHQKISVVFLRDHFAVKTGVIDKLKLLLALSGLMIRFFPEYLRVENKGKVALRLLQYAENALLLRLLMQHKIQYLYMFGGFENDANMTALFLQTAGIKLHKVPSANPLKNYYVSVVAHGFSFVAPFQLDEYELLKKNWFVDKTALWPVFNYVPLLKYLYHLHPPPPARTIGFVARGMWLRKERGDALSSLGEEQPEYETIRVIRAFALKHPDVKVYVFTHPIERKTPELLERARRYYQKVFDGVKIEVPQPDNWTTIELFRLVDISVASVSSSNIERLFCGYKTLYSPIASKGELFGNTAINTIVCKTEEKLLDSLEKSLNMTTEEFFTSNHLEGYHYNAYKQWLD